jgi:hypothetical protein
MPHVISFITLFNKTLEIFGLIREGKKRKDEKIDLALFALYTALCETRAYVHDLNDGKRRNKKKEWRLAMLWHKASVPLRYIDRDLARRCFIKGGYWLEPETWSTAKVRNNGIALEKVYKKTKELLLTK